MIHPIPDVTGKPTFSQFGEDIIIDHILKQIGSTSKFLVDIGANAFCGSNSKLFIDRYGFDSIRIDGNADPNNPDIKQHWILKENIVSLLENYGCPKQFGFLSIDIDGNDYYILQEILKAGYRPDLIVAEINPKWNATERMVIAYNPEHRFNDNDYYGMSYAAAVSLMDRFGYVPVYLQDGLNVYFVHFNRIRFNEVFDLTPYTAILPKRDWPEAQQGEWVDLNESFDHVIDFRI